jgi:large subunit ribosomal protein L29
MTTANLREKSVEELKTQLLALLKDLFNLRMQKGAGQAPKPDAMKKVKIGIARIKTLLHEKGSKV